MSAPDDPTPPRRSDRRSRRRRPPEPEPVQPEVRPRRRQEARREQRRERRLEKTRRTGRTVAAVSLVLAAALAGVAIRAAIDGGDDPVVTPTDPAGVDDPQRTVLFVTPADETAPVEAQLIVLLAHDVTTDEATMLLVPGGTLTEVPGHGLQLLRDANVFGGAALVGATVENLLGIDVDATVEVERRDWAAAFTRLAPVEVEVLDRLVTEAPDGGRSVAFLPGVTAFDGTELADLLLFRNPGESELEALPRAQRVLDAVLSELADPTTFELVFADGAPMLGGGQPGVDLPALFAGFVAADEAGSLDRRALPVSPVGDVEDDAYRPDTARIGSLVEDHLAGSVPSGIGEVRDLQILNGDGRPGIGADVAGELVPLGFRVVLTGNADTFDHRRTLVIIYRDDDEHLAAARRIVEALGVGEVQVSSSTQSVADVTIVVGSDFTP